jgi:hypothetical protein
VNRSQKIDGEGEVQKAEQHGEQKDPTRMRQAEEKAGQADTTKATKATIGRCNELELGVVDGRDGGTDAATGRLEEERDGGDTMVCDEDISAHSHTEAECQPQPWNPTEDTDDKMIDWQRQERDEGKRELGEGRVKRTRIKSEEEVRTAATLIIPIRTNKIK